VVGGPLFTHVASEMGQVAARNAMKRGTERMDLRVVPRVTFTDPEVASVGLTEAAAKKGGRKVRTGFARLVDESDLYSIPAPAEIARFAAFARA